MKASEKRQLEQKILESLRLDGSARSIFALSRRVGSMEDYVAPAVKRLIASGQVQRLTSRGPIEVIQAGEKTVHQEFIEKVTALQAMLEAVKGDPAQLPEEFKNVFVQALNALTGLYSAIYSWYRSIGCPGGETKEEFNAWLAKPHMPEHQQV